MIWIIASLPFWIGGVLTAFIALAGLAANIMDHNDRTAAAEVWVQFKGFLQLMLIAGALMYIGAKIAS